MNRKSWLAKFSVKVLTLLATFTLASCSWVYNHYGESCKSHAYLNRVLGEHISSRFYNHAPVRMGIVPFSVPANLSVRNGEFPGLGNQMAWQIHQNILDSGQVPIAEVLNRQDWPSKKDEFFTGNYGALAMAREAGYDLVLVGLVEQQKELDTMTAYSKILDVESGITVWYGKTVTSSNRDDLDNLSWNFRMSNYEPATMHYDSLIYKSSKCIVRAIINDNPDGTL